jgi:hypothetical protein
MIHEDIYGYIKGEEAKFETEQVRLGDNWNWNFRDHVQLIFHLKNGQFYTGENNWLRAFKNIMEPILDLSYWTEDIEMKDVVFFIENNTGRALSFLIKKYHDEVYVRENDLDLFVDEITESDLDYGGALVQKTDTAVPEVLPLNSIAFCDQTDILGGPMGFKMHFSPSKLRSMGAFGWGNEKYGADITLEELCTLAESEKAPASLSSTKTNDVTGSVIEVYIVRGDMPEAYLEDNDEFDYQCRQIQIRAFYTKKGGKHSGKEGVCLYRMKEDESTIKFHTSKKVYGRALGRGVGESLLHPQIWTNFLTIHKTAMLEAASKVPLVTDDPTFTQKNKIQDMENLEITTIEQGRTINRIETAAPVNIQLYEKSINEWYDQAQLAGSAFDPLLGKEQSSGTTFKGQERTVAQGRGVHDRRRGKRAKFIEEIYRDWIIPDIVRKITQGKEFLATLTVEELTWVQDQLATNYANQKIKEKMFRGEMPDEQEKQMLTQTFKEMFAKQGNKHLIKVLKDEFKDIEVKMGINIAGKQKDLVNLSDKMLSIFQFVFQNPAGFQQAMQIPALAKAFGDLLEFGGLNQADFVTLVAPPTMPFTAPPAPGQPGQGPAPLSLAPTPANA